MHGILVLVVALVLIFTIFGIDRPADMEETENLVTGEIPEVDREQPEDYETATFGVWCFWGPDSRVGVADGVIRTRTGYWEVKNSSYDDSNVKREVLRVDYDPEKVSYIEIYDMISETGQNRELHPFGEFELAGEYDQSYRLERHDNLTEAYRGIYPDLEDFINSTAVARVNGYVAGYGELDSPGNLEGLGLTEGGMQRVYDLWESNKR